MSQGLDDGATPVVQEAWLIEIEPIVQAWGMMDEAVWGYVSRATGDGTHATTAEESTFALALLMGHAEASLRLAGSVALMGVPLESLFGGYVYTPLDSVRAVIGAVEEYGTWSHLQEWKDDMVARVDRLSALTTALEAVQS